MSVSGYSRLRVWLHWLSAAVILWTLVSGFYVANIQVPAGIKESIAFLNVSLTTVFIPIFVWRLVLVVYHAGCSRVRFPSFPDALAMFAHALIYLATGTVLVTGVLMMDRPINVFGVFEIAQVLSDPQRIAQFFTLHIAACIALSILVGLHIGAVIFHELCNRPVLRRMSFCSKRRNEQFE
ncbi:cytochrome b [Pseudomonas sp. LB3P31]